MRHANRGSEKRGGDYPAATASHNIEMLMRERKSAPAATSKKYPGGRKQLIAVGINKARRGDRM